MTRKGINTERKLVHKLWKYGFAAIRVPASGAGGSSTPKPDIICGNGKRYLAFEVKTTKNDILYIKQHDVKTLIEFSELFGAEAYIAIKFKYDKSYYFLKKDDLSTTRFNNYKITKELASQKGLTFDMLLNNCVKINLNW